VSELRDFDENGATFLLEVDDRRPILASGRRRAQAMRPRIDRHRRPEHARIHPPLVALDHQVADPPVHVLGRKRGTNVFRPRSQEHLEDETFPGLLLRRPEGRIFFANAERVGEKMRPLIAEAKPTVVALDLAGVFDLEYTALKMLTEAEKRQRAAGVLLWLVGLTPGVLSMVQRSALGETLGRERMFFNLEQAVVEYQASSARLSSP